MSVYVAEAALSARGVTPAICRGSADIRAAACIRRRTSTDCGVKSLDTTLPPGNIHD
jgi:hypothetical protein